MEALKTFLSSTDPGALLALGFVVVVLLLSVYAFRHWAQRKKDLLERMPRLGFHRIEEPDPAELIPELLFHPDEFQPPKPGVGEVQDLHPRVTLAWTGRSADLDVTLMDVSIARLHGHRANEERTGFTLNRTVLRCPVPTAEPPPDFVLTEKVLFKSRVTHHRPVRGAETLGQHYFLFSAAADDVLERWIQPAVESALGSYRLWTIAAHDGVLYLSRGTTQEAPKDMESFLKQGEMLLGALLPEPRG